MVWTCALMRIGTDASFLSVTHWVTLASYRLPGGGLLPRPSLGHEDAPPLEAFVGFTRRGNYSTEKAGRRDASVKPLRQEVGSNPNAALAWSGGILAVSIALCIVIFDRRTRACATCLGCTGTVTRRIPRQSRPGTPRRLGRGQVRGL